MMKYEIDQKLAQAILNYLVNRPYAEVFQFVTALQSLKEIAQSKPPETPEGNGD